MNSSPQSKTFATARRPSSSLERRTPAAPCCRRWLERRAAALLLLSLAVSAPQSAALGEPGIVDRFSAGIEWRTSEGRYVGPYHATLLPQSKVALFAWSRDTEDPNGTPFSDYTPLVYRFAPTPLGQPLPARVTVAADPVPFDIPDRDDPPWHVFDYLNCGGHTLSSDGGLFVAGGSRIFHNTTTDEISQSGLSYAMRFDGTQWSRIADDMVGTGARLGSERWYPTVTRLADERLLVTSGIDAVRFRDQAVLSPNRSLALYDQKIEEWQLLSSHDDSPEEIWNPDYTHVFPQPAPLDESFDLLLFGDDGVPVLLSTTGPDRWQVRTTVRPGSLAGQAPNKGASSALLPLRLESGEWGYANGSVVVVGGDAGTSHEHSLDVYDPTADQWKARRDLAARRHHPMTVLLPDGQVLILGGHNDDGDVGTAGAQYFDPRDGSLLSGQDTMDEARGYHSVALLLPDGRVLLAGGTTEHQGGGEKAFFRYYYPPYMSRPRPEVTTSPATVELGQPFSVQASSGEPVAEASLVALGSMTHSFDTNQRHVQLEITAQNGPTIDLVAPPNAAIAPPGYYLLFALDAERTPSKGRLIRLLP